MTTRNRISHAQRAKAAAFAELHLSGCFVLPNAWDVASALLCREAGFTAVGTTSAGVAWAQGFPDGERFGRDPMLELAAAIAARVDVPVSAELEAGYGATPAAVAATVTAAVGAGLVGCNLEDSDPRSGTLLEVELAADRIRAATEAATAAGLDEFVVNARVDCYLRELPAERAFGEAVERANRYLAAGARSAFVPGPTDAGTAARLVQAIDGPLNIMAGGFAPTAPVAELAAAGVRRISLGGSLMAVAYGHALSALQEVRARGDFAFTEAAGPAYGALVGAISRQPEEEERSHA